MVVARQGELMQGTHTVSCKAGRDATRQQNCYVTLSLLTWCCSVCVATSLLQPLPSPSAASARLRNCSSSSAPELAPDTPTTSATPHTLHDLVALLNAHTPIAHQGGMRQLSDRSSSSSHLLLAALLCSCAALRGIAAHGELQGRWMNGVGRAWGPTAACRSQLPFASDAARAG